MISIKRMLLSVGLVFGLLLSARAEAQNFPEGPFQSTKYLAHAWSTFLPWQAATVEVDGQVVIDRIGFGPRAYAFYFTCPSDGLIRLNCPSEGPFQNTSAIIDYWSQISPSVAAYIYADNQLIYFRSGFGPAIVRAYTWCVGRPGRGYMTDCNLYAY